MACRSDYMDQTDREQRLQQTALLCVFVLNRLKKPIPDFVCKAAGEYYCSERRTVPLLCKLIRGMTDEELNSIVYDGHDATSRELATWWEEHQAADRAREEKEQREKKRAELRATALAKLSDEEREALGLP